MASLDETVQMSKKDWLDGVQDTIRRSGLTQNAGSEQTEVACSRSFRQCNDWRRWLSDRNGV